MEFISAPEYSKKYKIPINAVRVLANLEESPFNVRRNGQHVLVEDKLVDLVTVVEYAEKYNYSEQRVREMTKSEKPPFQVYFVGVKAYIKDLGEVGSEEQKLDEVTKELKTLKTMMNRMCKHLGVNLNDVLC